MGSAIVGFVPFLSHDAGLNSTTYANGNPAQVGIVGFGEVFMAGVSGGLTGTVTMPGCNQYGVTMPVNCMLDTICLTVGNPVLHPMPGQTVHTFAMLATAEGDSQLFTLHPATKVEVAFPEGVSYPAQVQTVRVTNLGFVLAAETRYMIVCGHYTTGEVGSTSYSFTYSGTLLFS